jgi:hypothetical protein
MIGCQRCHYNFWQKNVPIVSKTIWWFWFYLQATSDKLTNVTASSWTSKRAPSILPTWRTSAESARDQFDKLQLRFSTCFTFDINLKSNRNFLKLILTKQICAYMACLPSLFSVCILMFPSDLLCTKLTLINFTKLNFDRKLLG